MNPAFLAKLSHDGIDPGEASRACRPALEPDVFLLVVYFVLSGDEFGLDVDFAGQMPGDEPAVTVVVCCQASVSSASNGYILD